MQTRLSTHPPRAPYGTPPTSSVRVPKDSNPPSDLFDKDFPERRKNSPSDLGFSIGLLVVALIPRLFVALAWAREPVWDGHYYHFGAERIADGFGYSEQVNIGGQEVWKPWTHYPVGYSGLLAIAYKVFGSGILTAPMVNAFLGTLLVLVVHRIARYALSQQRARVAGTLCALHPGLIAYCAVVMTEPAAALFVFGATWSALALRHRRKGIVITGVLIGIGALIRPVSLLVLPALLLIGPKPFGRTLLRTILIGIVALATILPWTMRNCRVMDGCTLISTNGGWNLAIGALTETGRFRTLRADDGCPVVTGQVQQDHCWAKVGLETIQSAPIHWLSMVPIKLAQTYNHESFPIEYLREAAPELWPEPRRIAGHELLTLFHWILMTAAAFSPICLITSVNRPVSTATQSFLLLAVAAYASYAFANPFHPFAPLIVMIPIIALLPFPGRPSAGPAGRVLLALLGATTLTHAVFFGEDRYHLVVSPLLCILAAGALRQRTVPAAWARQQERRIKPA